MRKNLLAAAAILLVFASLAHAAGSAEAINFAEKSNHLLYDAEAAEIYPVTTISYDNSHYWVVSVISGGGIAGFLPIKDAKKADDLELAKGEVARKRLIQTAHYLRLYDKLKADFSAQGSWVLKNTDMDYFNALSNDLKNEKIDLTTIGSELEGYSALQIMAADLRDQLDELYPLASDIAGSMNDFKAEEADFFSKPDTNALKGFVGSLDDLFELVDRFSAKRQSYLSDLDELRQGIAQTALSVDSKRSLNSLATVPQRMLEVSSRITSLLNLQETMDEAYATALSQADNFVSDLGVREKRSSAWIAIYGFDSEIVEQTQTQGIDSLNSLVGLILGDGYIYKWNEQALVLKLQENWSKATAYYENGSFDSAESFAEKSKGNALDVFNAGLSQPKTSINTDLLVTAAVLLIAVLIILYVLRNRDRLSSLVSHEEEEEEVPLHEWEK